MTAPDPRNVKFCELPECGAEYRRAKGVGFKAFGTRRFCTREHSLIGQGRENAGRPRRTHCLSGEHELVGDNVRVTAKGRSCKACARRSELSRRPPKGPARPARAVKPKPAPAREIPAAPVQVGRKPGEEWPNWRGAPGWPLQPGSRWVA